MRSSERVVRRRLADGTVREYRYVRQSEPTAFADDTLGALIQAYKASPEWDALAATTQATYSTYLKVLEASPHDRVRDVKRRDILALRDAMAQRRGLGAATGFIRAASALFAWAVDREWIDSTPVTRIKTLATGHLPAWSQEHVDHALVKLPEHLRRAVILARYTGQRRGDLCALRWDAYDGRELHVVQAKTGAVLDIAVVPELKEELDAWKREARTLTILEDGNGAPWVPMHLTQRMAWHMKKHGMAGLGIHGVRKYVAARLADRGSTTHQITSVTGHKTLGMVQLYTASADQRRLAEGAVVHLSDRLPNEKKRRRK